MNNVYIGYLVGSLAALIIILVFLFMLLHKQIQITLKIHKLKRKYKAGKVLALRHVFGLPLTEFLICYCFITKENYIFYGDEREFFLNRNTVNNKYLATDIDIQKQAVSNVNGSVAGAMAFGAIGALLASPSKVIDVTTIKKLLILEYSSDEQDKTLAFDITGLQNEFDTKFYFGIRKQESVTL